MAIGKRMTAANETVDKNKLYTLDEAVKIVKSNATAKFDETIEVDRKSTRLNSSHSQQARMPSSA